MPSKVVTSLKGIDLNDCGKEKVLSSGQNQLGVFGLWSSSWPSWCFLVVCWSACGPCFCRFWFMVSLLALSVLSVNGQLASLFV